MCIQEITMPLGNDLKKKKKKHGKSKTKKK
jgi:hypothetical protein